MDRRTKIGASIAAGATAVVAVAAIAVASPTKQDEATPSPSTTSAPRTGDQGDRRGGAAETPLTGAAAEDATAAALAAVPGGTIIRVETDSDGGATYEAHVRKADGTEVVVLMDKEFTVTGVEAFAGHGGRGQGGRGGHGETALTGTDAEKATAAAKAAVAGGTVIRVETDADGGATYEAHVRKADGTEVVVEMDEDFTVTGVEEPTGRGGMDHDGDGRGPGASATASPGATGAA